MKAAIFLLVSAGIAALAAGHVMAADCNGSVLDVGGVAYVDDRDILADGIWVYAESNDEPGEQSGGSSVLLGGGIADPTAPGAYLLEPDADPCDGSDGHGSDMLIL